MVLMDHEDELYRRISEHLGRMTAAKNMNGRVSLDAAVNWLKRDAFIRRLKLSNSQLRQYVMLQATRDGYSTSVGPDKRSRGSAAPIMKFWITAPEKRK